MFAQCFQDSGDYRGVRGLIGPLRPHTVIYPTSEDVDQQPKLDNMVGDDILVFTRPHTVIYRTSDYIDQQPLRL